MFQVSVGKNKNDNIWKKRQTNNPLIKSSKVFLSEALDLGW